MLRDPRYNNELIPVMRSYELTTSYWFELELKKVFRQIVI